jgi:hypothetical protein
MLKNLIWTFFLLGAMILVPSAAGTVQAQTPVTLPSVEVDLWPEYDDPGVLVIYRITLPASMSLPAEFSLRIPKAAGEPNAVAVRDVNGSLMKAQSTLQPSGDWNTLKITATSPEIQVEYYDPGLTSAGNQRNYTYTWPGDYGVQAMTLQVQQPWDASQMQISPDDFGPGEAGADTLRYYTENIGAVPVGTPIKIQLGYSKPSDILSLEKLQPTLVAPEQTSSAGNKSMLPVWIGIAGFVLLAAGAAWYIVSKNAKEDKGSSRSRHKPSTQKNSSVPASGGNTYCSNCGRRAAPDDHFCRSCGTQLHS